MVSAVKPNRELVKNSQHTTNTVLLTALLCNKRPNDGPLMYLRDKEVEEDHLLLKIPWPTLRVMLKF